MSKTAARQRANARRIVEQQKAADRRRRVTLWTTVSVVIVLVIAGLVGWSQFSNQQSTNAAKLVTPTVAVDQGTAFKVGAGPVQVDLYEDFQCPICNEFEHSTGATVSQLVSQNKITVLYHPVSILDRESNGTEYSTRSAGAAAAAAEGGKFIQYHNALYQNQPAEGSDGLTNAQLIDLGKTVGLGTTFANAVNAQTYDSWAAKATDTFSARGYNGTPTILVAGKVVQGPNQSLPTTAEFTQAVTQAAG
jgi:protein-disulfide isomerase